MDRAESCAVEHHAAVRAAGAVPQHVLLPAASGECRESGVHAADRRAVSAGAILRQPEDWPRCWASTASVRSG
jgi:hypothetical protein